MDVRVKGNEMGWVSIYGRSLNQWRRGGEVKEGVGMRI